MRTDTLEQIRIKMPGDRSTWLHFLGRCRTNTNSTPNYLFVTVHLMARSLSVSTARFTQSEFLNCSLSACHSSSLPNGSAENVAPFPLSPPSRAPKPAEPMEGVYVTIQPRDMDSSKKKKRRSLALSKVFGKSRSRRSIAVSDPSIMEGTCTNDTSLFSCVRGGW